MTEYELADLALAAQTSATLTTAVFIAVAVVYLLAAWRAGARLSRYQVNLVNVLFILFQCSLVIAWCTRWYLVLKYAEILREMNPVLHPTLSPAPYLAFALVMSASIPACLKFMWDVRHGKSS